MLFYPSIEYTALAIGRISENTEGDISLVKLTESA